MNARSRFRLCWLLVLSLMLAVLATPAQPPAYATPPADPSPASLRVGFFTRTLATTAAARKGFFTRHNLSVQLLPVTSSRQQFQTLRDGGYDLILTSPDNVANYRLNPNNALGAPLDVQIIMGSDYGSNLSLIAQPEISSIADLRGKRVAVDARDSGFAFVLFKLLRSHGLEADRDYTVVLAGGTPLRFQALLRREFDATLLNNGFDLRAVNAGKARLATVADVASPYLGGVAAARESWLQQHPDAAARFIQAYYEATQWALDPVNREEAISMLVDANTPRSLAEQIYAVQVTSGVGMIADVSIDRPALLNVLALREEFGGFEEPQNLQYLATPGSRLLDQFYYNMALRNARSDH